jgi:hypothetical protein
MAGTQRIGLAATSLLLAMTTAGQANDACPASAAGDQPGYLVEVMLCNAQSPRCKADGTGVFQAKQAARAETRTLATGDVPAGDVITGAELYSAAYDLTNRGFRDVSVARHAAADYCSQHSLYDVTAEWAGGNASDHVKIDVCIRYGKWAGAVPASPCAEAGKD